MNYSKLAITWALGLAAVGCSGGDQDAVETAQPLAAEASAAVDQQSEAPRRHHGRSDPAQLIERLDRDGNGTLEASELPEHKRRHLAQADADSDGKITADELKTHHAGKKQARFTEKDKNKDGAWSADEIGERWQHLSEADANGDGKVTMAELDSAYASGTLRPHGRGRGFGKFKDPARFIEKFDANADGALQLSELPEHKREKFGAADANRDQKLVADELKAHFEKRRRGE
jgi:hypothetical protein